MLLLEEKFKFLNAIILFILLVILYKIVLHTKTLMTWWSIEDLFALFFFDYISLLSDLGSSKVFRTTDTGLSENSGFPPRDRWGTKVCCREGNRWHADITNCI